MLIFCVIWRGRSIVLIKCVASGSDAISVSETGGAAGCGSVLSGS